MTLTHSRLIRFSLWSLGSLVGAILLLLGVVSLLLYTEGGSRRVTETLFTRLNTLDGIDVSSGRISGNLLRGLTLDGVLVHTPAADIRANSVRASWNPYSILSGNFTLSALEVDALQVNVLADDNAAPVDVIAALQLQPLPIDVAVGRLRVSDFELTGAAPAIAITELTLGASLNGQNLRLRDARVTLADLSLELELQAALRDNIPLQATVNWEYRGPLFANYQLAVGNAAVTGDLENLAVEHALLAPEAIQSSGELHAPLFETERSLRFTHSTAALRLPYEVMEAVEFRDVSLETRWTGADLAMTLDSGVTSAVLPQAHLTATGSLLGSVLTIDTVQLATDTGALSGDSRIDWTGPVEIASHFALTESNPLQYLPTSLPIDLRDISGSGQIDYRYLEDENRVDLSLDSFDGFLGEYPLTGRAELHSRDTAIQFDSLKLRTSSNSIDLSGTVDETVNLNWHIDAPALQQLLTGYTGVVSGTGSLIGNLDDPGVAGALQVRDFATGPVTVAAADITLAGTLADLESAASLTEVAIKSETGSAQLERLTLEFAGGRAAHTVQAEIASEYGALSLRLQGGLPDGTADQWQGNLIATELQGDFGHWTQQGGPRPLTLSRTASRLPETCWTQQATRACVTLTQRTADQFGLSLTVSNFPLSEFNAETGADALIPWPVLPRLPVGIRLAGATNATLTGVIDLATTPQMQFEVASQQAVLTIASTTTTDAAIDDALLTPEIQQYDWDVLRIEGSYTDGNWRLQSSAELSQQNLAGTTLGLRGLLDSEIAIDGAGNLGGNLSARFDELGWVQAFLPELSNVSGNLVGQASVSGTLAAPVFAGELDLRQGQADLAALGLHFTGANSALRVRETGEAQFDGGLTSNAGNIAFSGSFTDLYQASRQLQAELSGSRFQVSNTTDAIMELSPDLRVTADRNLIHLTGNLDIPLLTLVLRELPESAVDISRDTVIVNFPEDRPELGRTITASENTLFDIPVAAEINLTLGEAVTVSGFGMDADLGGQLAIQQRPDGSNLTYGELAIAKGSYRIYGQELNLSQGKLLFFGAVDNPALDIRATREVEGVTVGVLMNGTLKNIRSQLFSTPALPENDIIAVLVTGRPYSEMGEQDGNAVIGAIAALGLDKGQGLTSQIRDTLGLDTFGINSTGNINSSMLTIGKYLTPDIFIHYGVGLFDRQSKIAIDYSLSERVKLQAESGEYQSLDVTYRVER